MFNRVPIGVHPEYRRVWYSLRSCSEYAKTKSGRIYFTTRTHGSLYVVQKCGGERRGGGPKESRAGGSGSEIGVCGILYNEGGLLSGRLNSRVAIVRKKASLV